MPVEKKNITDFNLLKGFDHIRDAKANNHSNLLIMHDLNSEQNVYELV